MKEKKRCVKCDSEKVHVYRCWTKTWLCFNCSRKEELYEVSETI